MERKIGEIFEYNGEWYQVVECDSCGECSLFTTECGSGTKSDLADEVFGQCSKVRRSDNKHTIFKKLEKVGEPITVNGKNVQLLKTTIANCDNCAFYKDVNCDFTCYPRKCHGGEEGTYVEIKQTKEDMEEKKDNYDGNMDEECIPICDALNSIPDVYTNESCCGHCKDRFMILLTCNNSHSLALIARVFDRRYIGTSQPWHIELQTKDSGSYDYFIHSETKYSSEEIMMKDVNKIIENIKYWGDDKFACYFKGSDDTKHSNSEKIGKDLKPFDLQKAKQGKPVCTRDGRKARILCYDFKQNEEYPILVAVENKDGKECPLLYSNDGISEMYKSSNNELAMFPEKKEGWVNVDKCSNGDVIISKPYPTRDEAIHNSTELTIDTVNIEWEE